MRMDLWLVVGLTAAVLSAGCDRVFGLDRPARPDAPGGPDDGSIDARLDQPLINIQMIVPLRPRVGVVGPSVVTATITGMPNAVVHHRFQTDQGGGFDVGERVVQSTVLDASGTAPLQLDWTPTALGDVIITGEASYASVINPSNKDELAFGVDRVLGHYTGGNTLSFGTDTIVVMKITSIEAGKMPLIGVVAVDATQIRLGVYDHNATGDRPGVLLRSTGAIPLVAGRNELDMGNDGGVSVAGQQVLWIAVFVQAAAAIEYDSGKSSSRVLQTPYPFGNGLPSSLPPNNVNELQANPTLYAVIR